MVRKRQQSGVIIKNAEQIDGIRKASQLSAKTLHYLGQYVKPGMLTE